jgi:hypothetical protein
MRIGVENLTIGQIAVLLQHDGYPAKLAAQVKFAAFCGTLDWSEERLVSTREIELDVRPDHAPPPVQ